MVASKGLSSRSWKTRVPRNQEEGQTQRRCSSTAAHQHTKNIRQQRRGKVVKPTVSTGTQRGESSHRSSSSGGTTSSGQSDEQRLLNFDQELNDTIVNSFLSHLVEHHQTLVSNSVEKSGPSCAVLLAVSSHFLPRWCSLWQRGDVPQDCEEPRMELAARMSSWVSGRRGSSSVELCDTKNLCLRHWLALRDLPRRYVSAPPPSQQTTVDIAAQLEAHDYRNCPQCRKRACLMIPVHIASQNHWILVALNIPAAMKRNPCSAEVVPLCSTVHVYDSLMWLHEEERGASRTLLEDEEDDCDGRSYRRLLLETTLRPLLAALQIVAVHRVLKCSVAKQNGSMPSEQEPGNSSGSRFRWRIRWHRFAVMQQNAVDCGVAVCKAAYHIALTLSRSIHPVAVERRPLLSRLHHSHWGDGNDEVCTTAPRATNVQEFRRVIHRMLFSKEPLQGW